MAFRPYSEIGETDSGVATFAPPFPRHN